MKKTIIFYSHNFWWLGHNKRLSIIIRELLFNFWNNYNCILLNSWENQDFLFENIEWLRIINLPKYQFINNKKAWNYKKNIHLRKMIFQKLFSHKINFDSLIIEHFPFWRNFLYEELKYLIWVFRKYNSKWNIFSSVRDIFDIESINKENLALFDRFLIHWDKNITNYDKIFPWELKNKIIYTWFVAEDFIWNNNFEVGKKIIYINIWWWQDWIEYIFDFLSKFEQIENKWNYKIIISLGNNYNESNINLLWNNYSWILEFHKYLANSLELKQQSLLSVSMGGYNNLVESLKYNLKTIVYPRQTDNEQIERLANFIELSSNIYNWLNISVEEIILLLNSKSVDNNPRKINYNWAYFTANFLINYKKYKYIKIRVTNACNAKCEMCWVIKRKREYNNLDFLEDSILDFYKLAWEVVNLTGWEPTIYNWFWELLKLSKKLNLITSVSTNGSTLWDKFFKDLFFEWIRLIDYIDISIDWLYEKQDNRRKFKWLFSLISNNLQQLLDLWIFIHINVTVRKDNISEIIDIFNYFKNSWVNSISFWMITSSPVNDTSNLIPDKNDIKSFYLIDKEYILKNKWEMAVTFSPDFKFWDFDNFINSIFNKNQFIRINWEKCSFINSKKEIRINENWYISPCCEIDDYDEWIWNINDSQLLEIICSKNYNNFLNKKFPSISKACLNCKIEI